MKHTKTLLLATIYIFAHYHNAIASAWLDKDSWLCWAAEHNHITCARYLLEHGADPNTCTEKRNETQNYFVYITPLYLAARNGNSEMIQMLLRAGADVDNPNCEGTAIDYTLRQKHTECARILIQAAYEKYEANRVQDYLSSILHRAIFKNADEITELLLHSGATPHYNPQNSSNALYTACKMGKARLVEQLLAAGADPNTRSSTHHQETALFAAVFHCSHNTTNIIELLLTAGADITIRNSHGSTVACYINCKTDAKTIQLLLKAGLDPNEITDKTYGTTPLRSMLARGPYKNSDAIEEILKRGALLYPQWIATLDHEARTRLDNHSQHIVHRAESIREFCDDASASEFPTDLLGVIEQFAGVPIIEHKAKSCAALATT